MNKLLRDVLDSKDPHAIEKFCKKLNDAVENLTDEQLIEIGKTLPVKEKKK